MIPQDFQSMPQMLFIFHIQAKILSINATINVFKRDQKIQFISLISNNKIKKKKVKLVIPVNTPMNFLKFNNIFFQKYFFN